MLIQAVSDAFKHMIDNHEDLVKLWSSTSQDERQKSLLKLQELSTALTTLATRLGAKRGNLGQSCQSCQEPCQHSYCAA